MDAATAMLLGSVVPARRSQSVPSGPLEELVAMGFEPTSSKEALEKHSGNMEHAVLELLGSSGRGQTEVTRDRQDTDPVANSMWSSLEQTNSSPEQGDSRHSLAAMRLAGEALALPSAPPLSTVGNLTGDRYESMPRPSRAELIREYPKHCWACMHSLDFNCQAAASTNLLFVFCNSCGTITMANGQNADALCQSLAQSPHYNRCFKDAYLPARP